MRVKRLFSSGTELSVLARRDAGGRRARPPARRSWPGGGVQRDDTNVCDARMSKAARRRVQIGSIRVREDYS
jgi:hypothetical protein